MNFFFDLDLTKEPVARQALLIFNTFFDPGQDFGMVGALKM